MIVKILIVIVVIIAIPLIIALFVKKDYAVEREIVINKPPTEVFNYVKFIKNQDYYSKWVMQDPAMKKDFTGTDATVGFIYAWDSKEKGAGKGAQEITKINEGKEINMEVRFERPLEGVAHTHMITDSVTANQTKIKWGMKGTSKWPMNFINLFMDGMLGQDLDVSLNNLKVILEK